MQRSKVGMSRAMLPEKHIHKVHNSPEKGWLSKEWDNKWNGITAPLQEDPSLRCQVSGICEGVLSCPKSKALISREQLGLEVRLYDTQRKTLRVEANLLCFPESSIGMNFKVDDC